MFEKDKAFRDSLANTAYPYTLPFLAGKVRKLGHDLPLPFGVQLNYVHQSTDLNLNNAAVAMGNSGYANIGFVKFEPVENESNIFNLRLDSWILPFLNVYGVYAHSQNRTHIQITAPVHFDIHTTPTAETFGFGGVLAYGWKDYFVVANVNFSWTQTSVLDNTIKGTITSLRLGRTIQLGGSDHTLNFSVGAQKQHLSSYSRGSIPISQIFSYVDPDAWQEFEDQIASDAQNWYDDLTIPQKLVVDRITTAVSDWREWADVGDKSLLYQFDKDPIGDWSAQFGIQYNYGKKWWWRLEYGIGRGRRQLLLSGNYRFGL